MSALYIRSLQTGDEAEWRRLWTLYLNYYETTLPEQVYTTTFSRLLSEDSNEFACLIAVLDDKPIGLTHYLFHRHCWKVENVCYLQDLVVDNHQRGTGMGDAPQILEHIVQRKSIG